VACYSPLDGFRSRTLNESGKRPIVFDFREGFQDMPITVPCGQCIGCKLEKARQWAMRCMHEASLHDENSFITLTYDEDNLPELGSLDKRAFPLFMKRLRKRFSNAKIRYYHCGEYGDSFGRPHYHSLLFGFDFPDKQVDFVRKSLPVWRSDVLESLWPFGRSEIGSVTFESAAYVARYVTKKITGDAAIGWYSAEEENGNMVTIQPEYSTMSRRPGIGMDWYKQFGKEVYASDSVIVNRKEMKPPRFYDNQFEIDNPSGMAKIKRARIDALDQNEQRSSRLLIRREVAQAKLKLKDGAL